MEMDKLPKCQEEEYPEVMDNGALKTHQSGRELHVCGIIYFLLELSHTWMLMMISLVINDRNGILSTDKDLQYIRSQVAVQIWVDHLVYDLIEEISSDEYSNDGIEPLGKYLISDPQGMARTRKQAKKYMISEEALLVYQLEARHWLFEIRFHLIPIQLKRPLTKIWAATTCLTDNLHVKSWTQVLDWHKRRKVIQGVIQMGTTSSFPITSTCWTAPQNSGIKPIEEKEGTKEVNKRHDHERTVSRVEYQGPNWVTVRNDTGVAQEIRKEAHSTGPEVEESSTWS